MSDNDINSKQLKSSIVKLETLETEFSNTMTQYEQAYINYINALNNANEGEKTNKKFTTIPKSSFYGTGGLGIVKTTTIDQCVTACSSNSSCSGATFNSQTQNCMLRSGPGLISPAGDADSAIVPELAQYANILQMLNQKLLKMNTEITKLSSSIYPKAQQEIQQKNEKKQTLESQYEMLVEERNKIQELVKEYESINQSYDDTYTYVQQQNSQYIFYFFFTLIVLFYTIKTQFFPDVNSYPVRGIFWLFVVIAFIVSLIMTQNPGNFFLVCLLILFIVLSKLNIIPTP
jgi:hypothetical protein